VAVGLANCLVLGFEVVEQCEPVRIAGGKLSNPSLEIAAGAPDLEEALRRHFGERTRKPLGCSCSVSLAPPLGLFIRPFAGTPLEAPRSGVSQRVPAAGGVDQDSELIIVQERVDRAELHRDERDRYADCVRLTAVPIGSETRFLDG
jgi:hypothetical protein